MTSAATLPNVNDLLREARVNGYHLLCNDPSSATILIPSFFAFVVCHNLEQLALLCRMRASFPVDTADTLDGGCWLLTVQGASMKRISITRKRLRGESMIILNSTLFTPY
jgi:hypothetical protein